MNGAPAATDRQAGRHAVTLALASVVLALLLYVVHQRPAYAELLSRATARLHPDEIVLYDWTPWALTLLTLQGPLWLGVVTVASGAVRTGYGLFAVGVTAVLLFVAVDVEIFVTFGRHVTEVLRLVAMPGGAGVGGDLWPWVRLVARLLAEAGAAVALVIWVAQAGVARLWRGTTGAFRRLLLVLTLLLVPLAAVVPHTASDSWRNRALLERLYGALPWDARFARSKEPIPLYDDPAWRALEAGIRRAYARTFPLIFRERAPLPVEPAGRPHPDVVLFLVESFRADVFTKELMPRLFEWSERGLRAESHHAGSYYSEAGIFSLYYGRSPLSFHSTLDAREPSALCAVGHRLGYECAYFSGHPKIWLRREVFVSAHAIERFVHDDHGGWNDWDRTAVANLLAHLARTDRKPVLAVVNLMSLHFPYEFPEDHERYTPAARVDPTTQPWTVGSDARVPFRNRYWNTVLFNDDLIGDALSRIDPGKTVVVVTGDHGESLAEDGRYGHGYGFPDTVARVPFAVVGPGVPAKVLQGPTQHADLIPTLVHLLTGQELPEDRAQGRSLVGAGPGRKSLLLAHCSFSQDAADVLLVAEGMRLRLEVGLRSPEVTFLGVEAPSGQPLGRPNLTLAGAGSLVAAFEAEMEVVRR